MNIRRAIFSAIIIWILGVSAYAASFFFPILEDPELQANLVLTIALIPSVIIGTYFYYKKGFQTNGYRLGVTMFIVAMFLDALITVPLFIIPEGGNHLSFFTDPGFWLIAVEYIIVVAGYWWIRVWPKSLQSFEVK